MNAREIQNLFRHVRTHGHPDYRGGPRPAGSATRRDAVLRWVLWELGLLIIERCQRSHSVLTAVTFTGVRPWQTGQQTGYILDYTLRHSEFVERFRVFVAGAERGQPGYQLELVQPPYPNHTEWAQEGDAYEQGGLWVAYHWAR